MFQYTFSFFSLYMIYFIPHTANVFVHLFHLTISFTNTAALWKTYYPKWISITQISCVAYVEFTLHPLILSYIMVLQTLDLITPWQNNGKSFEKKTGKYSEMNTNLKICNITTRIEVVVRTAWGFISPDLAKRFHHALWFFGSCEGQKPIFYKKSGEQNCLSEMPGSNPLSKLGKWIPPCGSDYIESHVVSYFSQSQNNVKYLNSFNS